MKTILKITLALLFAAQIFNANSQGLQRSKPNYQGVVGLWTNVVIPSGETAKGVFVIGGNAKIDGNVRENALIIRGSVELNGEIAGNLIIVSGLGKIGDNAKVKGDIINVGSIISISPKAEIGGSKTDVLMGKILPEIGWAIDWFRYGAMRLRLFAPQVKLCWGIALTSFILYLVLLLIFPKAVTTCMETVKTRPVTSFGLGILFSWIVIPILLFLLLATGIGILLIPFVIIAVVIASMFGKTALYCFIGHRVGLIGGKDIIKSPVLALFIGSVLVLFIYMLPVIGLIAWTAVSSIAFGAVIISAITGLKGEVTPQKLPPQTPPQSPGGIPQSQPPQNPQPGQEGAAGESPTQSGTENMSQSQQQVQAAETMYTQTPPVAGVPPAIQATQPQQSIDYRLLPRVGFWRRFAATLIDFCVFLIPIGIFHGFTWVLWFLYHFLLWRWGGATIGDLIVGIKIVREDGRELDWRTALIRAFAGILSGIAFFVGFFWAGWSREKKAWHDYIAGTIVVRTRSII